MREVSQAQVLDSLRQVGVEVGDGLVIHTALQFFGHPQGGLGMYLDALKTAVGLDAAPPGGTLAVPTFNFSFAGGADYDPASTPAVKMGVFSEFFRQQPGAVRTTHPMQSFAVMGTHAAELAAMDTPSAFDDGSAVDWMVRQGFKLLLLGADIQAASILHYSEQRVGVPYRYWKDFGGQVRRNNAWQEAVYRMYVRDMEIDARLEIYEVADELRNRGQWSAVKLNYGMVSLCRLDDFVAATSDLLRADPWRFVTNKPEANA